MARKNRKNKNRNRRDDDGLKNHWRGRRKRDPYGSYEFRTILLTGQRESKALRKTQGYATAINWTDSKPALDVQVELVNANPDGAIALKEGNEVRVEWRERGDNNWRELFQQRVSQLTLDADTGDASPTLQDELGWLGKSKDDFIYKRGKKRAKWYADDITRDICERYGIPVGALANCKEEIENLTRMDENPVKVLQKAWAIEREATGTKFVIGMRGRKLVVQRLQRSSTLDFIGDLAMGGSLTRSLKDGLATVLRVSAKGKGNKEKIEIEVTASPAARRRYGKIVGTYEVKDAVKNPAKARARAKRRLAEQQKPKQEITISMPGIPTLRRGDAVKVAIKALNLDELAYVRTVSHSVSGGSYTMEVTLRLTDPFEDEEGDKIRKKRCKEARKAGRKLPDFCGDPKYDPYVPTGGRKGKNRRDR